MIDFKGKIDSSGLLQALKKVIVENGGDGMGIDSDGLFLLHVYGKDVEAGKNLGLANTAQDILAESLNDSFFLKAAVSSSLGLAAIQDKWQEHREELQRHLDEMAGDAGGAACLILHNSQAFAYISSTEKGLGWGKPGTLINEREISEKLASRLENM